MLITDTQILHFSLIVCFLLTAVSHPIVDKCIKQRMCYLLVATMQMFEVEANFLKTKNFLAISNLEFA